jgi:hypothetical protein
MATHRHNSRKIHFSLAKCSVCSMRTLTATCSVYPTHAPNLSSSQESLANISLNQKMLLRAWMLEACLPACRLPLRSVLFFGCLLPACLPACLPATPLRSFSLDISFAHTQRARAAVACVHTSRGAPPKDKTVLAETRRVSGMARLVRERSTRQDHGASHGANESCVWWPNRQRAGAPQV